MTPSVTIWTSASTVHAQARVAQIISATRVPGVVHDSFSIAGHSVSECKESINGAFNRLVNMTMSDSTLHIVAVIPLYDNNVSEQIQTLYDACSLLEHNITLHILGLACGIRPIFEVNAKASLASDEYVNALERLKTLCAKATFSISYSLIDDYAENGAHIGFTIESLSRYISLIQIAVMHDYYGILSPALLNAHTGDNISIGVASLSFDRSATTRQLLGLGFIEALDNVGINNKEVDVQKAAREAESFLAGISERYTDIYEQSIRPLYREDGVDEGRVVALASSILDDGIDALKTEILSLLRCDTLSLPEKEAILGMILGRDNEQLRGMQYVHEGALLDDACERPINLYVDAFNRCCCDSGLLPVRNDFEALKKFDWDDIKNELEDSAENINAFNPLHDIKRLKQEIINTTSFIRDKQGELEKLYKSVSQREEAETIKKKWHKPVGTLNDIEYKEQPLDEKYSPLPGLKIKETVDLRKFFTPVKNQLDLGSCTSFAAVAMYEAMMNRAGVEGTNDMSAAFLYFYSNILKGRPAGGSNFYEQLEVLGTHGVCHEDLYIYDATCPKAKPSEQAVEDAKNHRVISARQIPLVDEFDKSETIKRNHVLLTSALSEGYPVGISIKVYDNLGKDGAFILHPEDASGAKEEGWHAMVIVGYSEENNFYIVRNSWGTEFGEDGYCYMPTAYIDDPDYMNFACIITEISDNTDGAKSEIPTIMANFAATETEIRIAAIRNAIAKVRVELKNSQKLYAEYYKYYQRLVMRLTMPKVQNDIRLASELTQSREYIDTDEKKRQLEEDFVGRLKSYKKNLQKIIILLFVGSLGLGLGWYFSQSLLLFLCFVISSVFCGLTAFGYKWWKRIKRRNLQDELDQVAISEKKQREKLLEMQIQFHVAGMWLCRFHRLASEVGSVYDRLVSYISALRAWQDDYTHQISFTEKPEGQMFRVLYSSSLIRDFFDRNKSRITNGVDLINLFERYQINPDSLEVYHQELQDAVLSVIDSMIDDFNIVNFILGNEYAYLEAVNLQEEMSFMINVGQPSYRNRAMNATSQTRFLIGNVKHENENQWSSAISSLFPMRPVQLHMEDTDTLILLTIHPQKVA